VRISKEDFKLFIEAPMHLWEHKYNLILKAPNEFESDVMNYGYEV